ncbi:putative Ig domain-containing protein [bacterium]|nr:putative Ig domain-containing protein [bacterium]
MKKLYTIQMFLLLILLQMNCENTLSPELGSVTLNIDWSTLEQSLDSQSVQKPALTTASSEPIKKIEPLKLSSTKLDTIPVISMVRITLEPGPVIFEFMEILPSYTIQAELGIYNILIEAMDQNGVVFFCADTTKILIKPPNQLQIKLPIVPNYPTAAPQFVGLETMNTINMDHYQLFWTHVAKADTFQLEESAETNFTSPVQVYSGLDTSVQITGKPDGITYYRVHAKNFLATSPWSGIVGIQVETADTLELTTTTLSTGVTGFEYQGCICFLGGTEPCDWELMDGVFPPGLTAALSDFCIIISGIPTLQGTYPLTIDIHDSGNPQQSVTFHGNLIIVSPAVEVLNVTLEDGRVDRDYHDCYMLPNDLVSCQWMCSEYPVWLTIDINGSICFTGMPDTDGTCSWDALGVHPETPEAQTRIVFTLNVQPALQDLSITPSTLDSGIENELYEASICAAGGLPPYTYTIIQGSLPAGLTAESQSCLEISGIPVEAGGDTIIIEVSDSDSPPAALQKEYIILIDKAAQLQFSLETLPDGYLESPYEQEICAVGGTLPLIWHLQPDLLPSGLTLEYDDYERCATITGTPEQEGVYPFTLWLVDSTDTFMEVHQEFSITIHGPRLRILTDSLPDGEIDEYYNADIYIQVDTYENLTCEIIDGRLPPGMEFYTEDGFIIRGTPTEAGEFPFTIRIADPNVPAQCDTQAYTLTIKLPLIWISPDHISDGTQNTMYSETITANGGSGDFSWTASGFPPGLQLDVNGDRASIEGIPSSAGNYSISVTITDNCYGHSESKGFKINIKEFTLLTITTTSLPDATQGVPYSQTIHAMGGATPYSWSVSSGSLPSGLSLNTSSGLLSGTPTTIDCSHNFTIKVTDAILAEDTQAYSNFKVFPPTPLVITESSPLPAGTVGTSYHKLISVSGGSGGKQYTGSIIGGSTPPGINFESFYCDGIELNGMPTASGTYIFTIRVIDDLCSDYSDTKTFSLTINSP